MADSTTEGSEENENWKLFFADSVDPTDFSLDENFENHPPDQETTDPEQSLPQGFDPPAGSNGCLPEPSIYQGPNQAAASTQLSIAQQHSGQMPGICTGNPSSQIPDSRLKKRGYDKKYRDKQKKQMQELVEGNERLEREKHEFEAENRRLKREKREFEEQMKSKLAALEREKHEFEEQINSKLAALEREKHEFEAENRGLKREKREFEEQMKSKLAALEREKHEFEAENRRLKREKREKREFEEQMKSILETGFKHVEDEVNSLKGDSASATELAKLGNKVDKLLQRTERKHSMSPTEEFWAQSQEEDSSNSAKKIIGSSDQWRASSDQAEYISNKGPAVGGHNNMGPAVGGHNNMGPGAGGRNVGPGAGGGNVGPGAGGDNVGRAGARNLGERASFSSHNMGPGAGGYNRGEQAGSINSGVICF